MMSEYQDKSGKIISQKYFYTYLNFSSGHGEDGEEYDTFMSAWSKKDQIIRKSKRDDKYFPIDHTIAITIDGWGDDAKEFAIVYATPAYRSYIEPNWFGIDGMYETFLEVLDKYYSTNKPQRGKYV